MYLIKKSTVFDQNIKSEYYDSDKMYFEKNIKIDEKVKFDKNIKFYKNIKVEKNVIYSTSPTSSHPFDLFNLIFSEMKRNFGKPRGNRLDFGIVTAVIWLLSWHHQQFQCEKLAQKGFFGPP